MCLEVDFSIVKKCWTNEKIQDEKNRLVYQLESILSGMGRIIDLLGGVDMELTDDEASLMTGYIRELNELTGNKAENLTQGGTYTLNGVQACAYARIRYGGGDDYRRTERQRTVLTAMVKKAQQSDLTTVNKLINEVCGDIQTSFSNAELLALASQVFQYSIGDTTGFPFTKTTKVLSKKTG